MIFELSHFLGFWTGRTILTIYQCILVLTLVSLLYMVALLSKTLIVLEDAHSRLLEGSVTLYGRFEFYFSAVDTCSGDCSYGGLSVCITCTAYHVMSSLRIGVWALVSSVINPLACSFRSSSS